MKKIILLLSFFQILALQAQVYTTNTPIKKLDFEPGIYTSNAKGQNIKLILNKDKTYDMSFFFGNYEVKNDTIYFNNSSASQKFVLKPVLDAPFSSTLKLKLSYELAYYYTSQIYIGTQTDANRPIVYKSVKDYLDTSNTDLTSQIMAVEKTKYMYLVDVKYDKTTVFKFQVPDNVHEAELEYNAYTTSETKLSGYMDASTNQFVISDGKTPILFDFEKEAVANSKIKSDLLAIEVKDEKNWLKNNGFQDDQATSDGVDVYKPPYSFVHKKFSSLSDATSETKKTPKKFLVIVFDTKNKNAQTEFEDFIKTNQASVSDYMYSEYVESYDKFNFYLATDKDKKWLTKNNITSDQELVFLNASGEMIYHTKGSLTEKEAYFSSYNSVFDELKKADNNFKIDEIVTNKKAAPKEVKSFFRKMLNSETNYAAIMPPPAPPVVEVQEQIKEVAPAEKDSEKVEVAQVIEYAADSSATAYTGYDDYYDIIKDKENLYKLKATKENMLEKWKQVFNYYKNKPYDKGFVQILKGELSGSGFTSKLFPKLNYDATDLDLEILDYVFANFKTISEPPVEPAAEASKQDNAIVEPAAYEAYYYEQDIDTVLANFFLYNNSGQNTQYTKTMKYYKKYLELSGFNSSGVSNYLNALRLNIEADSNEKEYLETFENYFNSIIKTNTNIYENLDEAYSKKSANDYADWSTYKNSFANLANDVSWYLVEKSSDTKYLSKAIKWSETSLIIEKNNHYYLDTLAQIYYKNGMKQKAIETEQKAIDAEQEGSSASEYKEVLLKMKNGTY
jgi:hypothetical protein